MVQTEQIVGGQTFSLWRMVQVGRLLMYTWTSIFLRHSLWPDWGNGPGSIFSRGIVNGSIRLNSSPPKDMES
jgi:hypothetical protein